MALCDEGKKYVFLTLVIMTVISDKEVVKDILSETPDHMKSSFIETHLNFKWDEPLQELSNEEITNEIIKLTTLIVEFDTTEGTIVTPFLNQVTIGYDQNLKFLLNSNFVRYIFQLMKEYQVSYPKSNVIPMHKDKYKDKYNVAKYILSNIAFVEIRDTE